MAAVFGKIDVELGTTAGQPPSIAPGEGVVLRPDPNPERSQEVPNRILRDGILRSRAVSRLTPTAELFYRRLMSVADDFGRYYADLDVLLSDCYPARPSWADESMVANALAECITHGLIVSYTHDGSVFLEIEKFQQRTRPGQISKFPDPRGNPRESAGNSGNPREISAIARATTTPSTTASASPPAARDWPRGGWISPEDWEAWWTSLVARHPNPNLNRSALGVAMEYLLHGQLAREAFEHGYECHASRWDAGFEPNLFQFFKDRMWEFNPRPRAESRNGTRGMTAAEINAL